jgi:hypothetical protein
VQLAAAKIVRQQLQIMELLARLVFSLFLTGLHRKPVRNLV